MKRAPYLRDIVVFGSVCSVYRDPRENSLSKRSQTDFIIGRSDETKDYKVFLQGENKVVVTQHVRTSKLCVMSRIASCREHLNSRIKPMVRCRRAQVKQS